jgi:hypothetical protein
MLLHAQQDLLVQQCGMLLHAQQDLLVQQCGMLLNEQQDLLVQHVICCCMRSRTCWCSM